LKTTQQCALEKDNLNNILQIINYLKKKVYTFKKNHESAERAYRKQKKILAEKSAKSALEAPGKPGKVAVPAVSAKPTDGENVEAYLQKNLDLKSKIKILEKDVQLWRTNFEDFQTELTSQRGEGEQRPKTVADRDYFLRMLDDYKEAYEERITTLTEENTKGNTQLEQILEENSLMKVEIQTKEKEIMVFEKEIRNLQDQKDGRLDTDTYEKILRKDFEDMQKGY